MATGEGMLLRIDGETDPAIKALDKLDRSIAKTQALIAGESRKMAAEAEAASARQVRAFNMAGSAMVAVGVVAGAVAIKAITSWATYDEQMSHVEASSADAAAHITELGEAAIEAGAKTVFSATEAAQAEENLAKAGLAAADILGGALAGALDLAAAGSLAVADAASITAGALTQYQLAGDKATHVADLLASGATKAQGEVSDLGLALTYVGTPLNALDVSIEDTTGVLALLADNMIIGERAGTSLRGMLSSLTSPSAVAAATMKELGIQVFDAQGKFIGMDGVAGQLNMTLGDATDAERSLALGRIFGNEQLQAANVLTDAGAEGVRNWTEQVNDGTTAASIASTKLDNLSGDFEKLQGAIDSALIQTGAQGNDVLRTMVQTVTAVVDIYNGMGDTAKQAALAAVGLTTAVTLVGGAYFLAAPKVAAFRAAVQSTQIVGGQAVTSTTKLGTAVLGIGKILPGLGTALGVGGILLGAYAKHQADAKAAAEAFADSLDDVTGALTQQSTKLVAAGLQKSVKDYDDLGYSLAELTTVVSNGGPEFDRLISNLGDIQEAQKEGVPTMHGYVEATEGNAAAASRLRLELLEQRKVVEDGTEVNEAAAEAERVAAAEADKHGGALDSLGNKMGEVVETVPELSEAEQILAERFSLGADAAHALAEGMAEAKRQQDILTGANVSAIESQIAFEAALDAADQVLADVNEKRQEAIDNGEAFEEGITAGKDAFVLSSEAGRDMANALLDIRDRTLETADAIVQQTGDAALGRDEIVRGRQALYDQAIQYGLTEEAAWAYVDQILKIPAEVKTTASFDDAAARKAAGEFGSYVDWVTRNRTINVDFDYSDTTTPGPLEGDGSGGAFGDQSYGDGGRYGGQSSQERGSAVGTYSMGSGGGRMSGMGSMTTVNKHATVNQYFPVADSSSASLGKAADVLAATL